MGKAAQCIHGTCCVVVGKALAHRHAFALGGVLHWLLMGMCPAAAALTAGQPGVNEENRGVEAAEGDQQRVGPADASEQRQSFRQHSSTWGPDHRF